MGDKICYYLDTLIVKRRKYFPVLLHPDYSVGASDLLFIVVVPLILYQCSECLFVQDFCLGKFTVRKKVTRICCLWLIVWDAKKGEKWTIGKSTTLISKCGHGDVLKGIRKFLLFHCKRA